jgi:septal ring factor EnvC (AmiA/AmiB activator)
MRKLNLFALKGEEELETPTANCPKTSRFSPIQSKVCMTITPETPNDRLDRLEATLNRFAEFSFQSYRQHDEALSRLEANSARHDEALSRLEANVARHEEALFRIEGSLVDLNTQVQRTNRSIEALSQTQAECLQLIATNTVEINRIWQYLESQSGNGRGGNHGQANS